MARTKGSSYTKELLHLTKGLFGTLTDVCLFTIFFALQGSARAYGRTTIGESVHKAAHLTKIINCNSLNRVIYRLKSKGYLEKKERYFQISQKGMDRLNRLLPEYEKDRPWDGIIYLITYDIPEEKRWKRDYLREYIEKLGCGILQRSVWLTPYNPKKPIINFVSDKKIAGLVLVSELKEGSYIGGKPITDVLNKVYKLDSLYEQYMSFIWAAEKEKLKGQELILNYLAILKKDPQLPFELLPNNWPCREANEYYQKELKRLKKIKKTNKLQTTSI